MDGSADLNIKLPAAGGRMETWRLRGPGTFKTATSPAQFNRVAYSAAHVVADPLMTGNPWLDCAVDWDATIAYRRHLWSPLHHVAQILSTVIRPDKDASVTGISEAVKTLKAGSSRA